MSEREPRVDPLSQGAGRLEAFSDAVMAVIITILALELRPPEGPSFPQLKEALPGLFIYVLSFAFIALYWNNHHHLLRATTRISGAVMWANMFLLFWLSLIPVLTEWLHDERNYQHTIPAASFGIVALLAGFAYFLLVRALIQANGRDSALAQAIASDFKGISSLVIYAAGVAFAFVWVGISYALYVLVAVIWLIPDPRFTRPRQGSPT